MSVDIKKLVRQNILNLSPYSSARDEFSGADGVFLDANENPNGSYNRYPDPHQVELKNVLGKVKSVSPDNIFLGNFPIKFRFKRFQPLVDRLDDRLPGLTFFNVSIDPVFNKNLFQGRRLSRKLPACKSLSEEQKPVTLQFPHMQDYCRFLPLLLSDSIC